ncbi:dihydrofolate reductase family protein [Salinispora oceanensis]|uniref:dihydrofolate reductase family protein n=1 Tax=Salinispora oceanensis TaxID=1050199 RepID=UPI0003A5BBB2|nr:dihydrofolate reductase family protein [Salinispora oceanensis]
MGKVVLDMTMSVDGCIAAADGGPAGLHDWFFAPSPESQAIIEELQRSMGAMVMGRRTYDQGASQDGFADNPFPVEHFVVSHSTPEQVAKGDTVFHFIPGVAEAVRRAQAAAGEREVIIGGGAQLAQQCLAAGLVDEMRLAVRPLVIDGGIKLFDATALRLENIGVIDTPEATHLRFKILR